MSLLETDLNIRKYNQCLGVGSHGAVLLGLNEDNGQLVALKEVPVGGDAKSAAVLKEIALMRTLNHPNIVKYYGAQRDGHLVRIVMEFLPGGTITDMVRKFGALKETTARVYAFHIAAGLHYLHGRRVCHRDLKGDNVLVAHDGSCKLVDFGVSKIFDTCTEMNSVVGTPWYMAPEVIRGEAYGFAADVWSFGATLFEMLVGEAPWSTSSTNPMAAMFKIANATEPPPLPDTVSAEAKEVIARCMCVDHTARIATAELVRLPWFAPLLATASTDTASAAATSTATPPEVPLPPAESILFEPEATPQTSRASSLSLSVLDSPPKAPPPRVPQAMQCHHCHGPALFACEGCRRSATRADHQFCYDCWERVHAQHPHGAGGRGHDKAPLQFADPVGEMAPPSVLRGGSVLYADGQLADMGGDEAPAGDAEWECGRCSALNPQCDGARVLRCACGHLN